MNCPPELLEKRRYPQKAKWRIQPCQQCGFKPTQDQILRKHTIALLQHFEER